MDDNKIIDFNKVKEEKFSDAGVEVDSEKEEALKQGEELSFDLFESVRAKKLEEKALSGDDLEFDEIPVDCEEDEEEDEDSEEEHQKKGVAAVVETILLVLLIIAIFAVAIYVKIRLDEAAEKAKKNKGTSEEMYPASESIYDADDKVVMHLDENSVVIF